MSDSAKELLHSSSVSLSLEEAAKQLRDDLYSLAEPRSEAQRGFFRKRALGHLDALILAAQSPLLQQVSQLQEENQRLRNKVKTLTGWLGECYAITGADPDDNSDEMLAPYAVGEVTRLMREHEELTASLASFEALAAERQQEIEKMREALREIAEHPHCSYDHPTNRGGGSNYGIGCADGHRCAAATAQRALETAQARRAPSTEEK